MQHWLLEKPSDEPWCFPGQRTAMLGIDNRHEDIGLGLNHGAFANP